MLFYLKFINHDVERLHELMEFFFNAVQNKHPSNFDVKELFPAWYSESIQRMEKLEEMLTEFLGFTPEVKSKIVKAFVECNRIEIYFRDASDEYNNIPTSLDFTIGEDSTVTEFLNNLFVEYLYKGQLGNKESTFSKKIGGNLSTHYVSFKESYYEDGFFNLCPFCGLETYQLLENEGRPDYDHLLAKGYSLFVFAAVNLKNLVPIGIRCNKKKGTNHLLYFDEKRAKRTISFFPYESPPHPFTQFYFKLVCDELPNNKNAWKGKWRVEIIQNDPNNDTLEKKIDTWDRIFGIKGRYSEYIQDNYKSLLYKSIETVDVNSPSVESDLLETLNLWLRDRYPYKESYVTTTVGLIPDRMFVEWALKNGSFLMRYVQEKQKRPATIDETMLE